jgi:hypothetical protein
MVLFPAGALSLLKRDPEMKATIDESADARTALVPSM